jgi:uncharacterized protein
MSTALITGASGGIGLELARLFAKDKHHIVLVARSETKLQELAAELRSKYGIEVSIFAKDLSILSSSEEIYQALEQKGINIDFLVNNAGVGDYGFFADADWANSKQMIDLNITALTYLTKLFVKGMQERGSGRILNVASTAAFQPGPLMAVYFATKAYVLSFSEAIANELKGTGVTVTALCPGATESGFQKAAALEESKMVKGRKMPSSAEVAAYGYRHLMKGSTVVIHGFMNRLLAFSIRFSPRNMVTNITRKMIGKAS